MSRDSARSISLISGAFSGACSVFLSADVQWCLDNGEALNSKKFIEHFDYLDRNQAQQRYGRVLNDYFNTMNDNPYFPLEHFMTITTTITNLTLKKITKSLTFQIFLGFNITFYLYQVAAKGIYIFKEIAHIRFPQSLEDLPSLFTLINVRNLLGINHIFIVFVKNLSILTSLKEDIRQLK